MCNRHRRDFIGRLGVGGLLLTPLAMALSGCKKGAWPDEMVEIKWDRDTCVVCNMVISDRRFAGQIRGGPGGIGQHHTARGQGAGGAQQTVIFNSRRRCRRTDIARCLGGIRVGRVNAECCTAQQRRHSFGVQPPGAHRDAVGAALFLGPQLCRHTDRDRRAERRQRTAKKRALAEEFWQTLHAARPEARLHTPADGLPGLLSVGLPGRSGQRLTYQLDVAGVSVSPGAACDNRGVQEPSHVLMALGGTAAEDALSTLRFSFGSANRPGDGKEAAERLIKILEQQ